MDKLRLLVMGMDREGKSLGAMEMGMVQQVLRWLQVRLELESVLVSLGLG